MLKAKYIESFIHIPSPVLQSHPGGEKRVSGGFEQRTSGVMPIVYTSNPHLMVIGMGISVT